MDTVTTNEKRYPAKRCCDALGVFEAVKGFKKVLTAMDEIRGHAGESDFKLPKLYDIIPKEEIAGFEATMQKIIASIVSEASGVACWVYVEKFIHKKSLQEMLDEWEGASKFVVVMDTLFEEYIDTQK